MSLEAEWSEVDCVVSCDVCYSSDVVAESSEVAGLGADEVCADE